jgi:hypothetical protein
MLQPQESDRGHDEDSPSTKLQLDQPFARWNMILSSLFELDNIQYGGVFLSSQFLMRQKYHSTIIIGIRILSSSNELNNIQLV